MATKLEIGNFILSLVTLVTVIFGGVWTWNQYQDAGADDWADIITIETKVLPYKGGLDLLVIHVKSKNPRHSMYELDSKQGDSYRLYVRSVPQTDQVNSVIKDNEGKQIANIDLMPADGSDYEFLPGAEMDDMRAVVVPENALVSLRAEMNIHNGTFDKGGKPDTDYMSASSIVRIHS